MRLRTVSCHQPGWRRIRRGRGFSYVDQSGKPVPADARERLLELAIPPAWTEVWICPHPRGHLQAVGTDADGRRQYLYHPEWRVQRDLEKFERVSREARELPRLRRRLRRDMRAPDGDDEVERQRILATAIRLLDLGCFRPGSDAAAESGSHGLTTLERQHVRRDDAALWFRFEGKAGIEHEIRIDDPDVLRVLTTRLGHRTRTPRVLVSRVESRWMPITAEELNERIQEITGTTLTAKDFRTWHATTTAACVVATSPQPQSQRGRQRRIREAWEAAAELLGNTPAVARSAYVDPRIIELFGEGTVLDPIPTSQNAIDRAVSDLLAKT
ncbi:MAG: DNA topoisomerase IB [Marmoricola sp.]